MPTFKTIASMFYKWLHEGGKFKIGHRFYRNKSRTKFISFHSKIESFLLNMYFYRHESLAYVILSVIIRLFKKNTGEFYSL